LRLRGSGSHGGQNGLRHIIETIGTEGFARLRVGIGSDYQKGRQVEYVLGRWDETQQKELEDCLEKAADAIESFVFAGLGDTMTRFNR
jgi:PTH1 family peptidyl-tRNA hydrolase